MKAEQLAVHSLSTSHRNLEEALHAYAAAGFRNVEPYLPLVKAWIEDGELLDLQVIQLRLSGGCLANNEVYVNAGYGYEVDLEVVGDAGTIHIAPANPPELRKQRYAGHPVEGDWLERFPAAYVLEMQRWIEDLRGGKPTGPDAWDGYISLLAVETCIASLHSGVKESFKGPQCPELYR